MIRRLRTWTLVLCLVAGCDRSQPSSPSGLPLTTVRIGQLNYNLEIAADEKTRDFGLMRRDSMPQDHGMIFVFPDEEPRSFWMLNTRIPLDILFLDGAGRVISVKTMQPYDENSTTSDGAARFAIELNAGAAAAAGIKAGDMLQLPVSLPPGK